MKINLILIIATSVISASAQPVLLESDFAPVGFTSTMNLGAATAPGTSGANQIWDFSGIITSPAGAFSVVTPASTPCSSLFPTANSAWIAPGPQYLYFDKNSTKFDLLGEGWPSTCAGGKTYSDLKQMLKFPFNYNETYTDLWQHGSGSGTCTVTYDAYGTLITPFGTYNNVIRLSIIDGSGNNTLWIATGSPSYWLMLIASNSTKIFSNAVTGIKEPAVVPTASIYPNPSSTGIFTVSTEHVSNNCEIEIFSLLGEKIHHEKLSPSETKIDIGNPANGIYFYKIMNENELITKGKLLVE